MVSTPPIRAHAPAGCTWGTPPGPRRVVALLANDHVGNLLALSRLPPRVARHLEATAFSHRHLTCLLAAGNIAVMACSIKFSCCYFFWDLGYPGNPEPIVAYARSSWSAIDADAYHLMALNNL